MFQNPMMLDFDKLREYVPPQPMKEPGEPKPFAATDSTGRRRRALEQYSEAVADLVDIMEKRERPRLPPPKGANGDARTHR
jgi:hypothetical protein